MVYEIDPATDEITGTRRFQTRSPTRARCSLRNRELLRSYLHEPLFVRSTLRGNQGDRSRAKGVAEPPPIHYTPARPLLWVARMDSIHICV